MLENKPQNYTVDFEEKIGVPGLSTVLAEQRMSELASVLIKSFKERSEMILPSEVFDEYKSKPEFYGPSDLDQRSIHNFNSNFYSVLPPDFMALDLSPIEPLGLNSTLSSLSQNLTLATIRGSEVLSDPTSSMAIEAAKRRRASIISLEEKNKSIKLASCARILRMQPFDKNKGYMQHYSAFALCSTGRDNAKGLFSEEALIEHLTVWLDMITRLNNEKGGIFKTIEVKISDIRIIEKLILTLGLSREEVNRNSLNEDWDMFGEGLVNFPKEVVTTLDIPNSLIKQFDY